MQEVWAQLEDWPNYAVSNLGNVQNVHRNRPLKLNLDNRGYVKVTLAVNGRYQTVNVHRLVALCFVSGYFDGAYVNHIDGDKTNNRYTNLEWVTNEQNIRHAVETGLIRKLRSWRSDEHL